MTIQVSNVPFDVTDAQLADLKARFSKFGNVQKFEVMNQIITVELDRGEDAAIQALDGIEWPKRMLPLPPGSTTPPLPLDSDSGPPATNGPPTKNKIKVKKIGVP